MDLLDNVGTVFCNFYWIKGENVRLRSDSASVGILSFVWLAGTLVDPGYSRFDSFSHRVPKALPPITPISL